jgi:hypothetical protein
MSDSPSFSQNNSLFSAALTVADGTLTPSTMHCHDGFVTPEELEN